MREWTVRTKSVLCSCHPSGGGGQTSGRAERTKGSQAQSNGSASAALPVPTAHWDCPAQSLRPLHLSLASPPRMEWPRVLSSLERPVPHRTPQTTHCPHLSAQLSLIGRGADPIIVKHLIRILSRTSPESFLTAQRTSRSKSQLQPAPLMSCSDAGLSHQTDSFIRLSSDAADLGASQSVTQCRLRCTAGSLTWPDQSKPSLRVERRQRTVDRCQLAQCRTRALRV